jgi:tetrahydromethanopterin S-methyltransferase subunit G
MVEEPESLTLVFLRRFDARMDLVQADIGDVKDRLSAIDLGLASVRREVAVLGEAVATTNVDRVERRLERIERRLDLVDAPIR